MSTSGVHLVTQPNTPAKVRLPLDAQDFTLRLQGLLHRDAIRRKRYGDEIVDEFRIRHHPPEARERYEEARRRAQEEWDNYVPSDTESEEEGRKELPAQAESQTQDVLPTPEEEAASGVAFSRLDTVTHGKQPAQTVPAAIVTRLGLLSPPARPKKRKTLAVEDEKTQTGTEYRMKRKRTLPRWARKQWAGNSLRRLLKQPSH